MLRMWVQRMQRIILASGSLRRKELLEKLGVEFEIVESGYDEDKIKTDDPVELVEELALQKALKVGKKYDDALIIGGDTTVYVRGELVGKPIDKKDAERIIRLLSGTTHMVVTGVAVVNSLTGDSVVGHEEGWVRFREITNEEIEKYVADILNPSKKVENGIGGQFKPITDTLNEERIIKAALEPAA